MEASHIAERKRAGIPECTVLDVGVLPVDRREFAAVVRAIMDGRIAELARDRNAICYRVRLLSRDGVSCTAIVKAPRPGPQRTNADATFAWEAEVLTRLPAAGIADAPMLLARVAAGGSHFLFTNEVRGRHPDARTHPLDDGQLRAILDRLHRMDRQGFMHYDLKAANILLDGDHAGFIDFEFARFEDVDGAYAPGRAAFCADFNVSDNPYFPARSNVANFEFRALHRYLLELGALQSSAAAGALLRDWLRGKSAVHRRMGTFLAEVAETAGERFAAGTRLAPDEARARLRAAAAHEELLAALFEEPDDVVAGVERSLMAYRCAVFEQDTAAAQALRRATLAQLRSDTARTRSPLRAYRRSTLRVLDLVACSVHPTP